MDLLARREHAPLELAHKLQQRGYEVAAVAQVLASLKADDLLSAERYAEAVVRARSGRGHGQRRIRAELTRMQIDDLLIAQAFDTISVDWFALARAECCKRFGAEPPTEQKERARRMRFLQQRGFEFDCIRAAVDAD